MRFPVSKAAFTLVELLASVALLIVLGLLIAGISSATSRVTALSSQAIDAASQARIAFDRIGLDLTALIKRDDTDFSVDNGGNFLLFLSSVTSAGLAAGATNRGVSVVAYKIDPHADNQNRPCLLRAGKAIGTADVGFMGLQSNGLPVKLDAAFAPATADFDVMAAGVIRAVVGFQLFPDNKNAALADGTVIANAVGQIVYSPPIRTLTPTDGDAAVSYVDTSRISALVIGFVTVDPASLRTLTAAQIGKISAKFPQPAMGTLPVRAWATIAGDANALPADVPLPARQGVRVFDRCYPFTP